MDPRDFVRSRERPATAYLHVTHRCDMACQHCFQTEETHPEDTDLSREEITRILDGLSGLGVLWLIITGGEPFLRRDLFDILADARKRRFAVSLKTAGHHITDEKAARLKALGLRDVDISLYSHDGALADAFTRRPGSWARAVRGIRACVAAGIPVTVRAAMTRFNFRHLRALKEFVVGMGAQFAVDPSVNVRTSGDRSTLDLALTAEERAEAWQLLGGDAEAFLGDALESCDGGGGFRHPERAMCGAGRRTISISAQGDVNPCVLHPGSAGNATRQDLLDIWQHSPLLNDIRAINYGEMARTGCSGCGYQGTCHPCMALATAEHGSNRDCNTSSFETARAKLLLARSLRTAPESGWVEPDPPLRHRSGRGILRVLG